MEPHERNPVLVLLAGFVGADLLLAILFFAEGALWALYGLLASPVALLGGLWILKRYLETMERNQLPAYLASRSLHSMVNEWNEANDALSHLASDWGWSTPVQGEIESLGRSLDPHVGRVRETGYWQPRRKRLRRLPLLQLQSVQLRWNALRAQFANELHAELQRRAEAHAETLAGLRSRGLATVVPASLPPSRDWKRVLAHLERMRDEVRLAAQEGVAVLARAPSAPEAVARVRDEAQARLQEDRPLDAIVALMRIRPAAPAAPRGNP